MNCRICRLQVTGETCTPPVAIITGREYILMTNCRHCSGTMAFVMWLSEAEAVERDADEQQYQRERVTLAKVQAARVDAAVYAEG